MDCPGFCPGVVSAGGVEGDGVAEAFELGDQPAGVEFLVGVFPKKRRP